MNVNLINLYELADENGIEIHHFPTRQVISMSCEGNIAINCDKVETTVQEKEILAHELGHCITGAFYYGHSPYELKAQKEYKANKWAVHTLIPYGDLVDALINGITERWSLAEYFGVTEKMIDMACKYYEDRLIYLRNPEE